MELKNEQRGSTITRYRSYADKILQATSSSSNGLIVRLMHDPCQFIDPGNDIDEVENDEGRRFSMLISRAISSELNADCILSIVGNLGFKQLARPVQESFMRIEHPRLSIHGLNPVVTVPIPQCELTWVVPNSKVLTYNLGI